MCHTPQGSHRGSVSMSAEPEPGHPQWALIWSACSGMAQGCSVRLGSGEFGGQILTASSLMKSAIVTVWQGALSRSALKHFCGSSCWNRCLRSHVCMWWGHATLYGAWLLTPRSSSKHSVHFDLTHSLVMFHDWILQLGCYLAEKSVHKHRQMHKHLPKCSEKHLWYVTLQYRCLQDHSLLGWHTHTHKVKTLAADAVVAANYNLYCFLVVGKLKEGSLCLCVWKVLCTLSVWGRKQKQDDKETVACSRQWQLGYRCRDTVC